MDSSPWLRSLVLVVQACLLSSCASSVHAVLHPQPEELPKLALVIEEGAHGQVRHSWRPAVEFQRALSDLPSYPARWSAPPEGVALVDGCRRDCSQEQIDCHRDCMRRKLLPPLNHIPRGHPTHNEICRDRCLRAYMDCLAAEKARALEFTAVDRAVEWLKEHRTELLVGTVVVITGVTFVAVFSGAGFLVLAPLTLMASAESMDAPHCLGD